MEEKDYGIKNLRVNQSEFLSKREYALYSIQQSLLEQGVDEVYIRLYTQYRSCRDYEELRNKVKEDKAFIVGGLGTVFGAFALSLAGTPGVEVANEISTAIGTIFMTTGLAGLGYSFVSSLQKKNPYDNKKIKIRIPGMDIHEVDKEYEYFLENAPEPVTLRKKRSKRRTKDDE